MIWIAALTFGAVFFLIFTIAIIAGSGNPVDERLERYTGMHKIKLNPDIMRRPETDHNLMMTLGKKVAPDNPKDVGEARQRLNKAGFYSEKAFFVYWGAKIILLTIFVSLAGLHYALYAQTMLQGLIPLMFALVIGLFSVDIIVYFFANYRQTQIFHSLPDVLDLLVVCVESGLGLDAAMQKVSEEFALSSKVMSEELNITCGAIRLGQPRSEALQDLGRRTCNMDLKSLVAVLNQAEKFGTSMSQALRIHANDMRIRRRQLAEELAAKSTVKLLFPLILFIFPSLLVVLAGPAIIRISETFSKM
jgi:tight adherence protein C